MPLLVKEHKQVNRSPTERAEHQDHIKFQKQWNVSVMDDILNQKITRIFFFDSHFQQEDK